MRRFIVIALLTLVPAIAVSPALVRVTATHAASTGAKKHCTTKTNSSVPKRPWSSAGLVQTASPQSRSWHGWPWMIRSSPCGFMP